MREEDRREDFLVSLLLFLFFLLPGDGYRKLEGKRWEKGTRRKKMTSKKKGLVVCVSQETKFAKWPFFITDANLILISILKTILRLGVAWYCIVSLWEKGGGEERGVKIHLFKISPLSSIDIKRIWNERMHSVASPDPVWLQPEKKTK